MADIIFRKKAIYSLIQDLAEIWFSGSLDEPRDLSNPGKKEFERMAKRICEETGGTIGDKTIKNYRDGKFTNRNYHSDLLAASWFVANQKKTPKEIANNTEGLFEDYLNIFRGRKDELMKYLGKPEGSTLEYKDKLISAADLAEDLCAFANKEGGLVIIGVKEIGKIKELIGLDCNEPAITKTKAAIGLSGSPKVEYGWGYRLETDKSFFLIRVSKKDILDYYRMDGKIYIRAGSVNREYDECNSKEAVYEKATKSRSKLIENFRSINSILNDHLDYYDNKNAHISKHEKDTLFKITYSFILQSFIDFLSEIWKEIDYMQPYHKNNSHHSDIAKKTMERAIDKFKKGDIISFYEAIATIPEIHNLLKSEKLELTRLITVLLERADDEISPTTIQRTVSYLYELAKNIDNTANNAYHLSQSEVRVDR